MRLNLFGLLPIIAASVVCFAAPVTEVHAGSNRPAETFAFMKNARLQVTKEKTEDHAGHVNWAMGQPMDLVKREIKSDAKQVLEKIDAINDKDVLADVFGYVKNSRLYASTGSAEGHAGHVNWAKGQASATVKGEIRSEIEKVNAQIGNLQRLPITTYEHTELGDHRRMQSDASLSTNGKVIIKTTTWTDKRFEGFTGGVTLFIEDKSGGYLHHTTLQRYGVDGKGIPGTASKRSDLYSEEVSDSVVKNAANVVLWHGLTPKDRLDDQIKAARKVSKAVKDIVDDLK